MTSPQSSRKIIRDRFQGLIPRMVLLYSQVAKDADVSEVALLALHVITLRDDPIYPSELSAQTGLPRSTVTRLLDALEDARYVTRSPAPDDGRRTLVAVRPDRVTSISARFDLYSEAMSEAARGFTSEELAVVARYLVVLTDAIEGRQSDTAD